MNCLLLFDLDDTLTPKGKQFDESQKPKFIKLFKDIKNTGNKISLLSTTGKENALKQLGDMIKYFDYIMVENGLVSMRVTNNGQDTVTEPIEDINFKNLCNKDKMNEMIGFARTYMRALFGLDSTSPGSDKPEGILKTIYDSYDNEELKTQLVIGLNATETEEKDISKQILWKVAQINFSPIGTTKDRKVYDSAREKFTEINGKGNIILGPFRDVLEENFGSVDFGTEGKKLYLEFNIGGSTGVDIFPKGWNKTYGYYFMKKLTSGGRVINIDNINEAKPEEDHPIKEKFNHILFFGDQALLDVGNDFEICKVMQNVESDLCIPVENPDMTITKLTDIFGYNIIYHHIKEHKEAYKRNFSARSYYGGFNKKFKNSKRHSKRHSKMVNKSKRSIRKHKKSTKHTNIKSRKSKRRNSKDKSEVKRVKKGKMNLIVGSNGAYMTSDFKI
jgi:hydroxymethylpyrimidine pyrophosphatase-like HAD family hydrolase